MGMGNVRVNIPNRAQTPPIIFPAGVAGLEVPRVNKQIYIYYPQLLMMNDEFAKRKKLNELSFVNFFLGILRILYIPSQPNVCAQHFVEIC